MKEVNSIGEQVRTTKTNGGDVTALLADLAAAKKTLEGLVRPQVEAATAAGNTDLREALMPAFEKVMTKGERKKRAKELKARAKEAGGAGAKKTPGNDGKNKNEKKGGKQDGKADKNAAKKKKKKANKKANAAGAASSSPVEIYDDPALSKNQLFLDIEATQISDGTLHACLAAGLRAGIQLVPRLLQQGRGHGGRVT